MVAPDQDRLARSVAHHPAPIRHASTEARQSEPDIIRQANLTLSDFARTAPPKSNSCRSRRIEVREMSTAMSTPKQIRGGLTVSRQRTQISFDRRATRDAVREFRSQAVDCVWELGKFAGSDRPMELSGITAMVQPMLLLPAGKPRSTPKDNLRHLVGDLNRHAPVHVREHHIKPGSRRTISDAPRAQPPVQHLGGKHRADISERADPIAARAHDLGPDDRTRRNRIRMINERRQRARLIHRRRHRPMIRRRLSQLRPTTS